MSFLQKLFSFVSFKNEDEIPQPKLINPYYPYAAHKFRQYQLSLARPMSRTISTQTDYSFLKNVSEITETNIQIPVSFIPKEKSFSSLSARFRVSEEPQEIPKTSSDSNQQNSTRPNTPLVGNVASETQTSFSQIPTDVKPNIKSQEKESVTYSPSRVKSEKSETFSCLNFKSNDSSKSASAQPKFKDEANQGVTFSSLNFKPKVTESNKDTFSSLNFKPKVTESNTDTFSSLNFKPKKVETQPDDEIEQSVSFKVDTKANKTDPLKSFDLDFDEAKLNEVLKKKTQARNHSSTTLQTNFLQSSAQNETGGFKYSRELRNTYNDRKRTSYK